MEEVILLNQYLEIDESTLETDEEKRAYVQKIDKLWGNIEDNYKTEDLLLKVLNKIKAFEYKKGIQWNKEELVNIYRNFPEDKKTNELYLNALKEIKFKVFEENDYHFRNDEVIEAFLDMIPEDLKNRAGYLDVLRTGINDLWEITRIYTKFIPNQFINQEFYEELIESLDDNMQGANYFWSAIPQEMRNQGFFLKIATKTDWLSFVSILKENTSFIERDNIVDLYKILVNIKGEITPYSIEEFSKIIPSELLSNEIYLGILNVFLNDETTYDKTNYDYFIKIRQRDEAIINFFASMPEEIQTEEILYKILPKVDTTRSSTATDFMLKIPEHLKSEKIYLDLIKSVRNQDNTNDKIRAVWDVLDKMPKEYINAELLVEIADLNNEPIIYEYMDKLKEQFESQNLYPLLMEKMAQSERGCNYAKLFEKIPNEHLTEENLLKMFEKKSDNAFDTNKMFKALLQYKDNFSQDFYHKLISQNQDYYAEIYEHMPDELKNEETFFLSLTANISNEEALWKLMALCPMDKEDIETYVKIMNHLQGIENVSNDVKSKAFAKVSLAIPYGKQQDLTDIKLELAKRAVNCSKTELDDIGNTVYSPKKLFEMVNIVLGGSSVLRYKLKETDQRIKETLDRGQIDEYIHEIIESEKNNFLKGIVNQNQIKQYEKDLKIDNKDDNLKRNPFWPLNAVYHIIPEELQYKYQNEIIEFIESNIDKLENDNNKNTIDFLKKIIKSNDDLFFTLDTRFLESDKYVNALGKEKYEVIVAFPEIQNVIANFDDNYFGMFIDCINYANVTSKIKEDDSGDWIPVADALCRNLNNNNFKEINNKIIKENFNKLSENEKNIYISIISKSKNWFDIKNIDDLKNYENIKNTICQQILENPDDLDIPIPIKALDKKERIIFARLQLEYGLDVIEAKNLVEKYAKGLSDEQKEEDIGILLSNLEKIINIDEDDIDLLRNINPKDIKKSDYKILLNLEAKCRESYLKRYNKAVYTSTNNKKDAMDLDVEYDGQKLQIYEPQDDFNMVIHALGAYSDSSKRENYKKNWNMPKIGNHGVCTSFIGNNNLGTARIVNVIYGFTEFTPEQLLLSAPWDIISRNANTMFSTSGVQYNYENGIRFCSPTAQINNTRHTHNEMVFDRRQYIKGNHSKKMQPSYIVYMPDYLSEKKPEEIDEIMKNRDAALKEYMEKDPLWQETKKAAAQFGVPIVMVDRAMCAKKESEKLANLVDSFEKTRDMSFISKIITEFENNRAGNRDYHKEITEKYFSDKTLEQYLDRIEKIISEIPTRNQRKTAYEVLKSAFDDESMKREAFKKTDKDPIAKFWQDKSFSIYTKEKRNINTDEIEIEQVIDSLEGQGITQINGIGKKVIDEIKDMKNRKLYIDKHSHSDRHIQNVMLFASILGKQFVLDEHNIQILIEAAKFHDSGRKSDNDRHHAEAGAKIAGEQLKGKYSSQDLSIIQIAIEYHEEVEFIKGKLHENTLKRLCEKYGLSPENEERAKKISELLKDADALDRTRFVGNAKLEPRYLHSNQAKELIELATMVNEEYAKRDLEDICTENEELRASINKFRAKNEGSSLYTAWAIRHHKFMPKKSSAASMQELYEVASEVSEGEIAKVIEEVTQIAAKDRKLSNDAPNQNEGKERV